METRIFTTEESIKFLRAAPYGVRFFLYVRIDAPIVGGDAGAVFADGCFGHIGLSRNEAIKLCERMLSPALEARGGRIPLSVDVVTIGGQQRTNYWIG